MATLGAMLAIGLSGCAVLTETTEVVTPDAPDTVAITPAEPAERLTIDIPKPRTTAPALKTTGTAWPTILASLSGYGQWLLANPDPDKVADVAEPGCAMANHLARQVQGLLASRTYLKPSPPQFATVTGPTADTETTAAPGHTITIGNKVTLDVTASRPSRPVISRTGQQITTVAPLPQTRLQITLHRGADNKWRFCTVTAMTAATSSVSLL